MCVVCVCCACACVVCVCIYMYFSSLLQFCGLVLHFCFCYCLILVVAVFQLLNIFIKFSERFSFWSFDGTIYLPKKKRIKKQFNFHGVTEIFYDFIEICSF